MNSPLKRLLVRWLVLALGVMLATKVIPGIECANGSTLLVVVLLLSLFNAVLKPLLVLFTLPFIVITLGFGLLVINALLFLLVGKLVDGFLVEGFWPALGGSLVVSLTHLVVRGFTGSTAPPPPAPATPPVVRRERPAKNDDVIDI